MKLRLGEELMDRYGFISDLKDNLISFLDPIDGVSGEFSERQLSEMKAATEIVSYAEWRDELREFLNLRSKTIIDNDYHGKIINERQKFVLDRQLDLIVENKNKSIYLDDLIGLNKNMISTHFLISGNKKKSSNLHFSTVLIMPYRTTEDFVRSVVNYNLDDADIISTLGLPVQEPYFSNIETYMRNVSVYEYQKEFKKINSSSSL
jgi:hypothetical protein